MQELIDDMTYMLTEGGERNICALREKARKLLEKEKEQIMDAYDKGWSDGFDDKDLNAEYYNETFKTNEK
jgi:DNA-binding PadR family transcriptional regulator